MRRLLFLTLLLLAGRAAAQPKEERFVKHVTFPAGCTLDEKIDRAARLVPSPQQLAWQQLELTAFLHFGINTFTDREWGDGQEDPARFNPTAFDADQIVRTLHEAGFRMVILTAKHHDGFCLWPTKTTRHSVASSPWRGGKGDVVREIREACDRYGMKFGVYLSPWDRNAPCYGDSKTYNRMFIRQLTELLTRYGEVHEVWFDGANGEGPNGKKQIYDWDAFYRTIRRLQPQAVTAIMGDDVRWVGNEKGLGRPTEWSATVLTPGVYARAAENNRRLGVYGKAPDLGSRRMLEHATELFWYPSEVDVSIRPGWFYHAAEDAKVKSLKQLVDIYFQSVGYNSVLLLNIPPDRRGRIHAADSTRLMELAGYLNRTFADDRVIDGRQAWSASGGDERIYRLQPGSRINVVLLQEDIARGQRIEGFTVEALTEAGWQPVGEGTTVGYKRLLRIPEVEASALRIRLRETRLEGHLSRVGAFRAEPLAEERRVEKWNDLDRATWRIVSQSPLTVDLGRTTTLSGFTYAPAGGEAKPDMAFRYRLSISDDGTQWRTVIDAGEFSNIVNNPLPQTITFPRKAVGRYLRLEATTPEAGEARILPEELGVTLADPKDDETALYDDPGAELTLSPGDPHPHVGGWRLYTAHEFRAEDTRGGLPLGFVEHPGRAMSRSARVDNATCSRVEEGHLHMWAREEPDSIDNRYGQRVKYSHACYRTAKPGTAEAWCNFTENMRIEIRFRRSDTRGFNDALWFMGNNGRPWPANGEIDLLENPKRTINQRAHFTLHSEHHYAGVVGGAGSVTATTDLSDMTQWNIYWLEWYPDRIVGGVNGRAYFEHRKGADGNTDWPWSDPAGFFLIFSSGLSVNPQAWPGAVDPTEWDPTAPPSMDVDWVRVYINDQYRGAAAPSVRYY